MTLHYLDRSAWIKRYFNESGSASMRTLFDGRATLACCRLGLLEVVAAISRRAHHEGIDPVRIAAQVELTRRDYVLFTHVELTENVWTIAESFGSQHHLRGADALHLAAVITLARQSNDPVILVSSDIELLAAAQSEGLTVLNPITTP